MEKVRHFAFSYFRMRELNKEHPQAEPNLHVLIKKKPRVQMIGTLLELLGCTR